MARKRKTINDIRRQFERIDRLTMERRGDASINRYNRASRLAAQYEYNIIRNQYGAGAYLTAAQMEELARKPIPRRIYMGLGAG